MLRISIVWLPQAHCGLDMSDVLRRCQGSPGRYGVGLCTSTSLVLDCKCTYFSGPAPRRAAIVAVLAVRGLCMRTSRRACARADHRMNFVVNGLSGLWYYVIATLGKTRLHRPGADTLSAPEGSLL